MERALDASSDEELAHAFAARANGALEEAYRRYASLLIAVARKILGAYGDAEDCLHDVLLRVWMGSHAYRAERGTLRAFLIVCVRNEALARRRSAARRQAIDDRLARERDRAEDTPFDADPIERAKLTAALRALPAEQRTVIDLAYFGGRTQTEISAALNVPLGTVKSRASLALRKLAHALSPGAV